MSKMYKTTGGQLWQGLAQGCYKYIEKNCIEDYNWEGQVPPAGLEQYNWYLPIDGSTGRIMDAFLDMYLLTKKPLYLDGMISTHGLYKGCWENPANLWINCHVGTTNNLMRMVEFED